MKKDFEPYGEEWRNSITPLTKEVIIELFRVHSILLRKEIEDLKNRLYYATALAEEERFK